MTQSIIKVQRAVTFGRFNIGHDGHVGLVRTMLQYAQTADICVSSGKHNNEWELRVLLLKSLLRRGGIDLERVNFVKVGSPYKAIRRAIQKVGDNTDVILVLGDDQREMGYCLSEKFDVFLSFNRRTNSSTNIRFLIDNEPEGEYLAKAYSNQEYPIRLARLLRDEEKRNERLIRVSKKALRTDSKRT